MSATYANIMIIISKVPFLKLFDHNDVQSSSATITGHIDNNILKDTLQL